MTAKRILPFIILIFLFLSGCVVARNYHVEQNLLEQEHIFQSTQAPSFSMKLSDDFKYLGQIDNSKNDSAHSYTYYSHYFVNDNKKFAASIQMIYLSTGEWNVYRPWKWDIGKEIHGDKPFYSGTTMYNLKLGKKEQDMYKTYDVANGTKITSKVWVYTPGGLRGGNRIIVRYFEKGDKTENLSEFIRRADKNVIFKMGSMPFKTKEKKSVADELLKLKKLTDDGIITIEEYNQQKQKLLDNNPFEK